MKRRPTNRNFLTLTTIQYTPSSVVSVLHRVTGLLLLFVVIWLLYNFVGFLATPEKFDYVINRFTCLDYKICFITSLYIFVFHIIAGFRHIFMDFGFFENMKTSNLTAILVVLFSLVYLTLVGYFLW